MCQSGSPIEPEDRDVEDSGIEDMGVDLSSTTSISSSIMKHREENGRTYHAYKEGKYQYPNDEAEKDRLDLQHHLFQLTFDQKIYTAPLDTIALHNVLDVGTGTGIWAIDFADEHPETQVLGVDLSPIQPMFTAPNATFQVDDLEEPWTFSVKFDYIHSRMMTGSFTNWPSFFEKCFGYLNPGGYVELADTVFPLRSDDDTLLDASPLKKHIDMCSTAANQIGRPLDTAKLYKEQLATAGFINITEVVYKWPINAWPKEKKMKEIGMWTLENLGGGLSGLSMALCTRVLGMSVEETESWLVEVLKDMKDPKIHAYFPLYVVYAQKPL